MIKTYVLSERGRFSINGLFGSVCRDMRYGRYQYYLHIAPNDYCNTLIGDAIGIPPRRWDCLVPDHLCMYRDDTTLYFHSLEGLSDLYWELKGVCDYHEKLNIPEIMDKYERKKLCLDKTRSSCGKAAT